EVEEVEEEDDVDEVNEVNEVDEVDEVDEGFSLLKDETVTSETTAQKDTIINEMINNIRRINAVEIPSWPSYLNSVRDNTVNDVINDVINDALSDVKGDKNKYRRERQRDIKSWRIIADTREKFLYINYMFIDLLKPCESRSAFFEELEGWFKEIGNILATFVSESRNEGRMNEGSIVMFRDEMKRYEHTFKPIINNMILEILKK
ncbi:MAG: hypothetical protein WD512_18985, partial [Candidatus Paceibacterota bacterium]